MPFTYLCKQCCNQMHQLTSFGHDGMDQAPSSALPASHVTFVVP